jgi:hypothetical protein
VVRLTRVVLVVTGGALNFSTPMDGKGSVGVWQSEIAVRAPARVVLSGPGPLTLYLVRSACVMPWSGNRAHAQPACVAALVLAQDDTMTRRFRCSFVGVPLAAPPSFSLRLPLDRVVFNDSVTLGRGASLSFGDYRGAAIAGSLLQLRGAVFVAAGALVRASARSVAFPNQHVPPLPLEFAASLNPLPVVCQAAFDANYVEIPSSVSFSGEDGSARLAFGDSTRVALGVL